MFPNRLDLDHFQLSPAAVSVPRLSRDRQLDQRSVAEECPVALVYDGTTAAVVMATPADLTDFAIGFSLTEGIVDHAADIQSLEVLPRPQGVELRMWLKADSGRRFKSRYRRLTGSTACGLCGIESLNEAVRTLPNVSSSIFLAPSQIECALEGLESAQYLNRTTRATHAAGFYLPNDRLVVAREDVGRHNALDKLAGAIASQSIAGGAGAVILTSRVSVEMVQKTAMIGACILVAISAPTALAVRTAAACGITLVAVARGSTFEIFSHPARIGNDFS